jgi:hypothetical protein
VGSAQQRPARLDGAIHRRGKVLLGRTARPEPCVVGQVDEDAGATPRELAREPGEQHLVAEQRSETDPAPGEHTRLSAWRDGDDAELRGRQRPGRPLGEGEQPHFVVRPEQLPARVGQEG